MVTQETAASRMECSRFVTDAAIRRVRTSGYIVTWVKTRLVNGYAWLQVSREFYLCNFQIPEFMYIDLLNKLTSTYLAIVPGRDSFSHKKAHLLGKSVPFVMQTGPPRRGQDLMFSHGLKERLTDRAANTATAKIMDFIF